METTSTATPAQRYSHKQLAALYNVSWITLQKWLREFEDEIGPKIGHFYSARQVTIIFDKLGAPLKRTG
jgi:transposase